MRKLSLPKSVIRNSPSIDPVLQPCSMRSVPRISSNSTTGSSSAPFGMSLPEVASSKTAGLAPAYHISGQKVMIAGAASSPAFFLHLRDSHPLAPSFWMKVAIMVLPSWELSASKRNFPKSPALIRPSSCCVSKPDLRRQESSWRFASGKSFSSSGLGLLSWRSLSAQAQSSA